MNDMDKRLITPDEAISLLIEGEEIHTFHNARGMLLGCDNSREDIIERLRAQPDKIEIGGPQCRKMGHGIILWEGENNPLFIESNEEKLNVFDPVTPDL